MKTLTIADYTARLQNAANQKGEAGVAHTKAFTIEQYMIVDEAGLPVDPSAIDIVIKPAAEAEMNNENYSEEKPKEDEENMTKSIRDAVRSELASVRVTNPIITGASIQGLDLRGRKPTNFSSKEKAYRFGQFILGVAGNKKSAAWCLANSVTKTQGEDIDAFGGVLVPEEFEADIITLREQFGVFRQNARVYTMARETLSIPRRQAGLTAYFVGESAAGTESTQTMDKVMLVARKLMALTVTSNELLEDAAVNIGDQMAGEIAQAFANKEDECGFNGDGTSTFGGIVGLKSLLTNSTYQVSDTTQTAVSAVTVAEVAAFLGLLPHYASANAKIFCNKNIFHTLFERLAYTAGGATATEFVNGVPQYKYQGIPVVISQVMTGTSASSYLAYYGDMKLSSYFGDRADTRIAFSDSALNAFEQDEKVIRGTTRFDIVNANVGSASASGAMVALVL